MPWNARPPFPAHTFATCRATRPARSVLRRTRAKSWVIVCGGRVMRTRYYAYAVVVGVSRARCARHPAFLTPYAAVPLHASRLVLPRPHSLSIDRAAATPSSPALGGAQASVGAVAAAPVFAASAVAGAGGVGSAPAGTSSTRYPAPFPAYVGPNGAYNGPPGQGMPQWVAPTAVPGSTGSGAAMAGAQHASHSQRPRRGSSGQLRTAPGIKRVYSRQFMLSVR